jgi:hypothetical protein
MASNECIPYFDNGDQITCATVSGVTGKRFVSVGGAPVGGIGGVGLFRVETTGAGAGGCIGVAAYDAPANSNVSVVHEPSIIVPVTAGAGITAGNFVQSDAQGRAIPFSAGVKLGIALDTVLSGADCPIDRSVIQ